MAFSKKETVLISFVVVAVLIRFLPHPPNVAPITAVALFAGTFFNKKHWAFLMPLLAMVITDMFLGFSTITPIVYFSFLAITAVGILFKKMNIGTVLLSSFVFLFSLILASGYCITLLPPKGSSRVLHLPYLFL